MGIGYDFKFIKDLIDQGHICFKNGEFAIWGLPLLMIPMNSMVLLQIILGLKLGKIGNDLLYQLGAMQARRGAEILYKKFGYKRNKKTAEFSNQQSRVVGVGIPSYIKFDMKNKHFIWKNQNTPFAKQYVKLYGVQKEPVCHFIRGIYAGASEAHCDSDLTGIETQCIAMGKPYCVFEIKESKKWDKSLSIVKNQFPERIIDEKTLYDKASILNLIKQKH